jgi:uncharacterized protein
MKEFQGHWGLITGASSGIGEEFARRLAERGMNLILAARREDRLKALAEELSQANGIQTKIIAVDLLADGEPAGLVAKVADLGHPIELLVNNAGFGLMSRLDDTNLDEVQRMLALNVSVLTALTYAILPNMLARQSGAIVNIASLAAFQPVVYMPAYGATKSYVLHFSESLWAEARQRNVLVMAVCPGFTKTEFFDVAGMTGWYTKFAQTSQEVVAISIKALRRRRPFVVCGRLNWLTSLLPRFVSRRMIVVGSEAMMRPPKKQTEQDESANGN